MSDRSPPRGERLILIGIFCAALLAHFYSATLNWTSGFMPGHEFRQAQTAIVSRYIDEQNNFSLLYETPILGKPWVSVLLEVPVYEWSVVILSRLAGIPHFMAARAVSLACFYLALPALYLLLGRLGVNRTRRLISLALVLACPVYIFYSRAFLMESMELMCCAWFLLGFVRTMDERRWTWLGVAIVAGTGGALIKSIGFAVWLLPAAGYGAWCLWRDRRAGQGWKAPLLTVLWGAATVAPALGALRWWINLTDPIKAAHASAWIFTSRNLSEGNWGLLTIGARFSPKTWGTLLERWKEAIMPPWIIGLGLVVGLLFLPRVRWRVLGLAAVFFLAQFIFPFAYAYQDYYFYACTVFLLAALAFVLEGLLDSRLPRWGGWLILLSPFVALTYNYWHGYRPVQILRSDGGFPFTAALRDVAPKDSVIIVCGADWAAMIPLYVQHKALMVRNGLEFDRAYLQRAFDDLNDEEVSALVLVGAARANRPFLDLVAARFDLDTVPTFSHPRADVYFQRPYVDLVQERLKSNRTYADVTVSPRNPSEKPPNRPFDISSSLARYAFPTVFPAPVRGYFAYGLGHEGVDGDMVLSAHPDSDLWLRPPTGAVQIKWEFGILEAAYERSGEKTDGVEFVIAGESEAGSREIYRRVLDPANQPADRGRQQEVISYQALPGEILRFSSRPYNNSNFDWAYWARIEVK
jgi:hypothetical protein